MNGSFQSWKSGDLPPDSVLALTCLGFLSLPSWTVSWTFFVLLVFTPILAALPASQPAPAWFSSYLSAVPWAHSGPSCLHLSALPLLPVPTLVSLSWRFCRRVPARFPRRKVMRHCLLSDFSRSYTTSFSWAFTAAVSSPHSSLP